MHITRSWLTLCLCSFLLTSPVLSELQVHKQLNVTGQRSLEKIQVTHKDDSGTKQFRSLLELTSTGELQIPKQLIMTGKPETFEEMSAAVQANIQHTLSLSGDDVKFRWFGDQACRQYIKDHYEADLLLLFDKERHGYYRGDICRAAVLYQEGGFYLDVDLQLAVPLTSLVDADTTFASAYSHSDGVYNAIIATVPKSPILAETLKEIRGWYANERVEQKLHPNSLMGTFTMLHGMQSAMNAACSAGDVLKKMTDSAWKCGEHSIRMYAEMDLRCFPPWLPECPAERQKSPHFGLRLGLFPAGSPVVPGRVPVGWSRFVACDDDTTGCGSGGHAKVAGSASPFGVQQPKAAKVLLRSEVEAHKFGVDPRGNIVA